MTRGVLHILVSGLVLSACLGAWPLSALAQTTGPVSKTVAAPGNAKLGNAKLGNAKPQEVRKGALGEKSKPSKVSDKPKPTEKSDKPELRSSVSEEDALAFARVHHPELANLLDMLRGMDRTHYEDALRDLSRDVERLSRSDRDVERYRLSLDLWKLDSRIRLDVARHKMSGATEFEASLRPLVQQRREARVRLIELERNRAAERVAKLDQELTSIRARPDEQTTQEIAVLKKSVSGQARPDSKSKIEAKQKKPNSKPLEPGTPAVAPPRTAS